MITRKYINYNVANSREDISILCDCENSETLNIFLNSDVRSFAEWIKADIDEVISGKIKSKEINGNVCHVEVNIEFTRIYDMLAEDDDEYLNTCCEVDTIELRELIEEWCDRVRKFTCEHHN